VPQRPQVAVRDDLERRPRVETVDVGQRDAQELAGGVLELEHRPDRAPQLVRRAGQRGLELAEETRPILLHASVIRRSSGARMSLMWRFGASMDDAVAHGIKSTAGVVTSAAIVMVAVFSIFATLSLLFFKRFGVGLAAAILIDATLVRAVLLPATMKLLGDRNWYLPTWLEWLPRLEPEEPSKAPEAPPVPVSA
jgi:hypothetical protein